jgi:hypothetical protein
MLADKSLLHGGSRSCKSNARPSSRYVNLNARPSQGPFQQLVE